MSGELTPVQKQIKAANEAFQDAFLDKNYDEALIHLRNVYDLSLDLEYYDTMADYLKQLKLCFNNQDTEGTLTFRVINLCNDFMAEILFSDEWCFKTNGAKTFDEQFKPLMREIINHDFFAEWWKLSIANNSAIVPLPEEECVGKYPANYPNGVGIPYVKKKKQVFYPSGMTEED